MPRQLRKLQAFPEMTRHFRKCVISAIACDIYNCENQPAQNKNKVKKKREKGRWSWPKNGPKSPNLKQKWPKLPQKLLRTRFQKRHEGQRVCFHNTGKRTKWKMKNPRKLCFVQSFCISFC